MTTIKNILLVFLFFQVGFVIAFAIKRSDHKKYSYQTIVASEYTRIENLAEGANSIVHFPLATANSKSGLLLSPDALFSAVSYDLSENPLGIYIPLPESTWSVSFYDESSNNYYSLDDRYFKSEDLQLVLATADQNAFSDKKNAQIVRSPSSKGIVIIRYVVPSADKKGELLTVRNEMKSGLLKSENI